MKQSVTILEAFGKYLLVSDLAAASIELKSRAVKYLVELVGDIEIKNLRGHHIDDFKFSLPNNSRTKASANIYLRNIKPFFKWLFKRRLVDVDLFDDLKFFKVGEVHREIYTPDEIERMMLCCSDYWQAIITLGLLSLRRSEVLNLTVDDIYFDRGYVLIKEKRDTVDTWAWNVKNHNQEIVALPPRLKLNSYEIDVHGLVERQIAKVRGSQPYIFVKPKHYKLMFKLRMEGRLNCSHKNLPYNNFSRDFREILRRAKVPNRRFHDLRATFATQMAQRGMSLVETQKLMRHSDPKTTAKYYIRLQEQQLIDKVAKNSLNFFKTA